jgi:hypothetical protein
MQALSVRTVLSEIKLLLSQPCHFGWVQEQLFIHFMMKIGSDKHKTLLYLKGCVNA